MNPIAMEFAAAARRAVVTTRAGSDSEAILQARADANAFCEYAFNDDQKGMPLVQAWHHRLWQRMTDEHDRLVMWFPIEHGKTTQAKMKLCRLLGQHPDRQYAFVSSKQNQAKKVLGSVKREIEGNPRLKLVYPDLAPQLSQVSSAREEWGNTSIRVAGCPRGSKDPSLSAFGLDGQILGARFHGVIIDNPLDKANTRTDTLREWVLEVMKDEIFGRVMKGGFIWILDTAWFEDDALHVLSESPGWESVKLDAEVGHGDDETLWPAQWSKQRLEAKKLELGALAFDRQFKNLPMGQSTDYFKKHAWEAAYGRCPWFDEWPEWELTDLYMSTGIDLATRPGESNDLTAAATAVARGGRRRLVNLQSDRMGAVGILELIIDIFRKFHMPVIERGGFACFVVEDNAAQVYIAQLFEDVTTARALGLTEDEADAIRVVGRTTTSNRRDEQLGIPSLAVAIEMGRWDVAANPETQQLREEMRVWSPDIKHYGDRLMALWHADAGLKDAGADEAFVC